MFSRTIISEGEFLLLAKKAAGNERFEGRDLKRFGNCKSLAMQIKPNKFKESGNFVYFA
jgi:hypothetical protein